MSTVYLLIQDSSTSLASQVIGAFGNLAQAVAEKNAFQLQDPVDYYTIQEIVVE